MIMKAGDKEHFRYVSTMPGAQYAVTTSLTHLMLKYFADSLKDLIPAVNRYYLLNVTYDKDQP